jgi:cytochrome c oxidase subunit 1
VPFAVIVFAMIATLWGGAIRFETPMLFALGGLTSFLLGGVTGIFLGSAATDIYLHGTYFVVAHFHYTLFPVTFFAGFAGIYYWYPKMFGRMMNETLGKVHFWVTMLAFQGVFLPLFLSGIAGTPRRVFAPNEYPLFHSIQPLQVHSTIATVVLLLGQLPFVVNFFWSLARGKRAEDNPWLANTLEWSVASPPPHENFERTPRVHRWPYEYSAPGAKLDWKPQAEQAEMTLPAAGR